MGTVSFFTKINRACRIISDNGLGDFAGFGDGPLCIIDDQFLAKCIDEKLQSANHFYPEGSYTGELDRVSDQVTPESSIGGDDRGIVLSYLNIFEPNRSGLILAIFFYRHELIENAMVKEKHHAFRPGDVLGGKESFAGIVHFEVMDVTAN